MALPIKNPEADQLARELASRAGMDSTEDVVWALREQLRRAPKLSSNTLADELLAIGRRCAALPILDARTADELVGYDENGLPK